MCTKNKPALSHLKRPFIFPYIKCVGCNACSRDWQHVTWWVIPVFLRLLMGVLVVLVLFYFVHCVTRTKQKTIENFVCRKRKYGTEFKYQFFRLYFLFQIACNCVQIIKSSVQCIFVSKVEEFPGQSPGLPLVTFKYRKNINFCQWIIIGHYIEDDFVKKLKS